MADNLLTWFKEELLPGLIKSGKFSENGSSLKECIFETNPTGVSSFASASSYAKLVLNTPEGGEVTRNIIIKFQSQDPVFREKMKLIPQFQNEVTMYNNVLGEFAEFLKHHGKDPNVLQELAPKCYYAHHSVEDPKKSLVVMEDLRLEGFKVSKSVTELDFQHCAAAFGKLAQFHAVSYAMKFQNWDGFEKLKNSFVHVWGEDDPWTRKQCEDFRGFCTQRGIEYLMSQKNGEVPVKYLENLRNMLEPKGLFELLKNLGSPKEPLSVICHGDFNRNNVLFRYDDHENVIDARLIDFQTFLYASPCLDLTFFIYMNTTLQFREKHFDDLLKHYHTTLIKSVSHILNETEETVEEQLPYKAFEKEFERLAPNALVLVSFFLPIMMAPSFDTDFVNDMIEKDFKELALENIAQGGEVVSKRIAEVIVDFYRRKFFM